jgi:hypothetical protein
MIFLQRSPHRKYVQKILSRCGLWALAVNGSSFHIVKPFSFFPQKKDAFSFSWSRTQVDTSFWFFLNMKFVRDYRKEMSNFIMNHHNKFCGSNLH